jgi:hypothetical protein
MDEIKQRLLNAGCVENGKTNHIETLLYHVDGEDAPPVVVVLDHHLHTVSFRPHPKDTHEGFAGRLAYMLKGI